MGGIGFVARRDFRRRWRRVLLLTVVVGAVGAFALVRRQARVVRARR